MFFWGLFVKAKVTKVTKATKVKLFLTTILNVIT